jgi:hypothetical protein
VRVCAARGANDLSFVAAGAQAFRRDVPGAEIHLLNASHFAKHEKTDEIAKLIRELLAKRPK